MEINLNTYPTFLGSWQGPIPSTGDDTQPPYAVFNGCHALLADWAGRRATIATSPDLNDLNQAARQRVVSERLTALANEILGKADRYQPLIDNAQATIEAMQNKLGNRKPASDIVSVMRASQIVNYYQGLPAENRLLLIKASMEQDDRETLVAVLSAPRVLNLVADTVRKACEAQMIQASNPGEYRALTDLKAAVGVASACLERLKSYVRSDASDVNNVRGRLISDSQSR